MARLIKIPLYVGGKGCKTLDEIRDNFNIEDILKAFKDGTLKRWFEAQALTDEITKIDNISIEDDINTANGLCRFFMGDEVSEEQINKIIYPLKFKLEEREILHRYAKLKEQRNEIIKDYHEGYKKLLSELDSEKGNDYSFVKEAVQHIFENYFELWRISLGRFYKHYIERSPLVILALLASGNENVKQLLSKKAFDDILGTTRNTSAWQKNKIDKFYNEWKSGKNQPNILKIEREIDRQKAQELSEDILVLSCRNHARINGQVIKSNTLNEYPLPITFIVCRNIVCRNIFQNKFPTLLPHIKIFNGERSSGWEILQPPEKRCMIIKMSPGSFVVGQDGKELNEKDVNGNFPIIEGIKYKCIGQAVPELVYMEI